MIVGISHGRIFKVYSFHSTTALSRTSSSKRFCLVYSLAVCVADDKIQWFVAEIWAEEQSWSPQKLKKFMINPWGQTWFSKLHLLGTYQILNCSYPRDILINQTSKRFTKPHSTEGNDSTGTASCTGNVFHSLFIQHRTCSLLCSI